MRYVAQPFTEERLRDVLAELPRAETYRVSFSGGADSTALLHALCALRRSLRIPVAALHVDHGLHPESDRWRAHCQAVCASLDVPLEVKCIRVDPRSGRGPEAEARQQRYRAAEETIEPGDILLTAHHREDQAETVLLNLMRGSGVDGLAGMPAVRPLGRGLLARPLLNFSGSSLREYLRSHRIAWIEDSSNRDEGFDRNFIRQRLLPLMSERWPGAQENLAATAAYCREAAEYLDVCSREILDCCLAGPRILDLAKLEGYPGCEQAAPGWKRTVRRWLRLAGAPSLPRSRMEELCRQLECSPPGRPVTVDWAGWTLRRYRRRLWLHRLDEIRACPALCWDTRHPLHLGPGLGSLHLEGPAPRPGWRFTIRPRRAGDRIACLPAARHKKVKRVLQEAAVPPWLRPCVPLLLDGESPGAVANWAVTDRLRQRLAEGGFHLRWSPSDPALAQLARERAAERG